MAMAGKSETFFVEDLVDALLLAREPVAPRQAEVFNIGGGPGNTRASGKFCV